MEDLPEVVNLSTLLSIHPDSLNPPLLDLGGVYDPRTRTFSISPVDAQKHYLKMKGKERARETSGQDDNDREGPSIATSSRQSTSRAKSKNAVVERAWNEAAKATGAAGIRIVNEFDKEPFPLGIYDFVYLENTWEYGPGAPKPEDTEAFLIGCSCTDGCKDPQECDCQLIQQFEVPMYAHGKFTFQNQGREVVECNKNCSCKEACRNRVAQLPRKVVIEIFKTMYNGWGVRPTTDVKKGTVLGMYTGKIVLDKQRNSEDVLEDAAADDGYESEEYDNNYSFDLDTRDHVDNVDSLKFYSVVSEKTGNWTRFVNHSCDPNAKIYTVVYDTPLEANTPHLVYVAHRDIRAGTEITIDYYPSKSGKKSKPRKGTRGGVKCVCGSGMCRGWI